MSKTQAARKPDEATQEGAAQAQMGQQADAHTEQPPPAPAPAAEVVRTPALPPVRKLHQNRFSMAESARRVWTATPEEGTPFEDLLRRDHWTHIAASLRPGDFIEVTPDEMNYFAWFKVLDAGQNWANVVLLFKKDFDNQDNLNILQEQYKVQYRGPHHRYCIIRLSDEDVVHVGCQTQAEGNRYIADHWKELVDRAEAAATVAAAKKKN